MAILNHYIKHSRSRGKRYFTGEEAISALQISKNALRCAIYKMKKAGDVISPARNLYVMIPPEDQIRGCIPAEELIPILMKHWNIPYYVCLLSAADYYGASHQKPQVFQVMVEKQIKPMVFGKVKIEFIYKKSIKDLPTESRTVNTGYLNVSTPELTVMDLLIYPHRSGGLNHIATVLSELIESIQPEALMRLMKNSAENAWIQRLGYILEHIESIDEKRRRQVIDVVHGYLKEQVLNPILLTPELAKNDAPLNSKWAIIENTTIESDL
jgi:predicted transcriptional regulator of viral defense system